MKRLVIPGVIVLAAAAAGWFMGTQSAPDNSPAREGRTLTTRDKVPRGSGVVSAWARRLDSVRKTPATRADEAWAKWAFSVPDAEVPDAIARLDPYADFTALRCLYARWAGFDARAARASFKESKIPRRVRNFSRGMSDVPSPGLINGTMGSYPRGSVATAMLHSMAAQDAEGVKALAQRIAVTGSPESKEFPDVWHLQPFLGEETKDAETVAEAAANAAKAAALREDAPGRHEELRTAVKDWVQKDGAAAGAWLRQLPVNELAKFSPEDILRAFRQGPATDAAMTAAALLEARRAEGRENGRSGEDLRLTVELFRDWAGGDMAAAKQYLEKVGDSDLKATLTGAVAGELVRTDINAALKMLEEVEGDTVKAIVPMMHTWMKNDARAALAWAARIEDAELREKVTGDAASSLAIVDADAALQLAGGITDATVRRQIYKEVRSLMWWNPAGLRALQEQYPGSEWDPQ